MTTDLWTPDQNVVIDPDHLRRAIEELGNRAADNRFTAFTYDLETRPGPSVWNDVDWSDKDDVKFHATNPRTNEIYWCSFASTGMAFTVPLGHPNGEQIGWQTAPLREGTKSTKRQVPKFAPPPEQMLMSEFLDIIKPLFFSDLRKVNHNIKFDLLSIAKYYGELPPPPYVDTIVAKALTNEEPPHGLEYCVPGAFGYRYDKIGKNLLAHPFSAAARYSFLDSRYAWLLLPHYFKKIQAEGLEEYFWFECDVTEVLAYMEWHGAPVRGDEVADLDEFLRSEMETIKGELWAEAGRQFELTKPVDKGWFIFDHCGHDPFMFTAKRKDPSLAADHLNAFTRDARVARMMEYDDTAKLHSTYVLNYQKYEHNGRIHTSYRQAGTVTGRFSCVSGSTLLPTSRGVFRFDEYSPQAGDLVRTHTGGLRPVLRKIYKGRDEMFSVRLSTGSVIECTQDHRLLTSSGWRRVGDLRVGDRVQSYVGVEVLCDQSKECEAGAGGVLCQRQANSGSGSDFGRHLVPQRPVDCERTPLSGEGAGRESTSVLTFQDGRVESDAWQEWVVTPQPQRGRSRRAWLRQAVGRWPLRAGASTRGGGGFRDSGPSTTRVDRSSSHRREQAEQLVEQPGGSDPSRTSIPARQDVCIAAITPLGSMGVWDIEVEGDHSYLTQGFINHNSGEPNLQNVPKPDTEVGKRIRGLFWGGSDDHCLVVGDYSQIELRMLAHYSGDPTMCQAFEDGLDIHQASADTLGTDRNIAKNINFAIPFGAGYRKVAAMGGGKFSEATAKKFYDLHHERFPRVWAFINKTKDICRQRKPHEVQTILGRKRRLPKIVLMRHPDEVKRGIGAQAARQAVNCFDAETEALTQRGWVRGFDLLPNDKFLTKNASTGVLEWRHAVRIHKFPEYTGPLVRVSNGRSLDVWTTPDHRWLTTYKKTGQPVVKTSEQLASLAPRQSDFAIHMQGEYHQEWSVYSDDFASLLGWVLTDGYFGATFVGIAQMKERGRKEIEALLDRMGLRFNCYEPGNGKSAQYKIHGHIAQRIKELCPEKTLTPEVLLGMGDSAREALFEAMMLGDGTVASSGKESFAAGSEERADAFQFLCTLLGRSSSKFYREYPVPAMNGSTGCWNVAVNKRKTAQTAHCDRVEDSVGGVWCVTVPNSFAVFRRAGGTFVSGNTVIQGSAADLIKKAMIRLHDMLDDDMHLILQVHDELVVVTPREKAERCIAIMREAMEGPEMQILRVPVTANIAAVDRWSEAKP